MCYCFLEVVILLYLLRVLDCQSLDDAPHDSAERDKAVG